ncbi:hypothetical protein MMP65_12685 [Acinetobacter sp. ANC 3926]|uniref:hypothetical protein n=1 Tax=Acinetobacter genomosp. 15BJ TaxID=106651 RepID=UPI001F4A6D1F|nr:hypothetical protein [Acinetobacter genomosp. 15BJ]MCH7292313.1 hypothetical protein [Acinetobacter genomosp. 15BJ]
MSIFVYKHDGTTQCQPEIKEITLDEMEHQLGEIIGKDNILSKKKGNIPVIYLCGTPTGNINIFELTESGAELLINGVTGDLGFKILYATEDTKFASDLSSADTQTNDLLGHTLRVYHTGDAITKDFRLDRYNIELSKADEKIVSVWKG